MRRASGSDMKLVRPPTEATNGWRFHFRHRGRVFPGRRGDQIGRARHATGVLRGRPRGNRRPHLRRIAAVANRGRVLAAYQHGRSPQGASPSAADIGRRRRRARSRLSRGRHASHRDVERFGTDPERALRRRDARPADDRAAQHAVRDACACRAAGSRCARRPDVSHAAVPAPVPGALDVVAVLAIPPHRAQGLPARGL